MEENNKDKTIKKSIKVLAWICNVVMYWIAIAFILAGTQGAQNISAFVAVGVVALVDAIVLSIVLSKIFKVVQIETTKK